MPSCHSAPIEAGLTSSLSLFSFMNTPTEHVDANDKDKSAQREQWRMLQCLPQVDHVKSERTELVGVNGDIRRNAEEETIAGAA